MAEQKSLVEDLAQFNQTYIKKFEDLKLGIEPQPIEPTTNDGHLNYHANPVCWPGIKLQAIETNSMAGQGASGSTKDLIETQVRCRNDPRFTHLQHYLSMLTAMLSEVDEVKYQIESPSRSRVRGAIHDTFDQELHFLAHPFGDELLKHVRDHFASLVAASRDKWNPHAKPSVPIVERYCFQTDHQTALLITR